MRTFFQKCCCFAGEESEKKTADVRKKNVKTWRIFSLRELHSATNNFNYDNKLGEGGFGSVYWGQLASGDQIAVKRLRALSTRGETEFAVEVEILGHVRHKNLLSLRGYCAEGQERLIVYEYMPKPSLFSHLHGQFAANFTLNWPTRMKIAIGAAEGLAYLHHYATPHIIHRDVKASNVLLDEDFEAQVADFGFAKLVPDGATHITTGVKGTLGYLAPEYAMWGKVSESCDVYSYGILVLELISGRKPIQRVGRGGMLTILEWAGPLVLQRRFRDLVDPKLHETFEEDELTRLVQVAVLCAQNLPENRPTMQEVVEMLTEHTKDPMKEDDGLHLEPVKYDPALLAADE
ncbi:hypothetical protein M758_4G239000 [Ceratodon purpureus]|nr:hypothetical protein M758_4G239000 [Ceratodon purpureus]